MKFSKTWWKKFQNDRGITWRRICGNRKTYTCGEVETERERVRAIISAYGERNTVLKREHVRSYFYHCVAFLLKMLVSAIRNL